MSRNDFRRVLRVWILWQHTCPNNARYERASITRAPCTYSYTERASRVRIHTRSARRMSFLDIYATSGIFVQKLPCVQIHTHDARDFSTRTGKALWRSKTNCDIKIQGAILLAQKTGPDGTSHRRPFLYLIFSFNALMGYVSPPKTTVPIPAMAHWNPSPCLIHL